MPKSELTRRYLLQSVAGAAVGVPLIVPVEALSDNPDGSDPLMTVHVRGPVPEAVRVCE